MEKLQLCHSLNYKTQLSCIQPLALKRLMYRETHSMCVMHSISKSRKTAFLSENLEIMSGFIYI